MCVISIIRFLTDHRVAVPLAVTTRLLETHDVRTSASPRQAMCQLQST